jgi:hypothetical protein
LYILIHQIIIDAILHQKSFIQHWHVTSASIIRKKREKRNAKEERFKYDKSIFQMPFEHFPDAAVALVKPRICDASTLDVFEIFGLSQWLLNVGISSLSFSGVSNLFFLICAVGLWVLRPLLAYCTSPG